MKNRREFLKVGLAASLASVAPEAFGIGSRILPSAEEPASSKPWEELPRILSRIKPPTFPARDFEMGSCGSIVGDPEVMPSQMTSSG